MFTKAPWKTEDYGDPNDFYIVADGTEITKVYSQPRLDVNTPTRPEAKANAQLIAAAPDLLNAVYALLDEHSDCKNCESSKLAFAAIKKATS